MVDNILTGAGFILNSTYRETRFLKPPNTTYAVYSDSQDHRGPDDLNLLVEHDYTIELYEYSPDPEAEAKIETEFTNAGIAFTKQPRYWIQEEQLYQVVYDFVYIEKKGA